MSLKNSIVIVNEYTTKNKSGKGGSRGGTPGQYVLRYMARDGATETDTPVSYNNENYITHYMARDEATESFDEEGNIHVKMHPEHKGGRAFGNGNISLSHKDLMKAAKDTDAAFDRDNKTVLKTVISFDEDYLRENGILDDGFVFTRKGDYRGHIDQMKLRNAIMKGMEHLSAEYDDLKYIGVIQVDTAHVHCHLAMYDNGVGTVMPDGTQRGKLSAFAKQKLRRGIDMALDESKEIQFMASNVDLERRNIQTTVKKYAYNQITLYGAPQKLMSVLPEDENVWRASTNRKEMKTANKICKDYVEKILAKPNSGMTVAMQQVYDYADARARREDLDDEAKVKLVRTGRERIIESCMNSVYATLKQIPKKERSFQTDFMTLADAPMIGPSFAEDEHDFVYKMRAYSSRLDKHRQEAKKYSALVSDYEENEKIGAITSDSHALYEFFLIEQEYNLKLASKYSQILFFDEPNEELVEKYLKVAEEAKVLDSMEALANDKSVKNMKPANADVYGIERYGVYGGRYVVLDPDYFDDRIETYRKKYEVDKKDLDNNLAMRSLKIETVHKPAILNDDGSIKVPERDVQVFTKAAAYDFDDIKGLDLHNIRGDFSSDLEFSGYVKKMYVDMAHRRIEAYDKACKYLDNSGQSDLKGVFDSYNIESMRYVLQQIEANNPVHNIEQPSVFEENKLVTNVDKRMHAYISGRVRQNVQNLEYAEMMNLQDDSPDGRSDTDDWYPSQRHQ